ncbi:MAG: hypothetical protein AAFV90_07060 [Cyanobacteria bacterium J06634_5]
MLSFLNETPEHANIFFKDFLIVATIVATLIVVEFLCVKLFGANVFYLLVKRVHDQLPYPSMPWRTTDIHNRFKGILNEPGDVGNYVLPAFIALASKLTLTKNERTRLYISALLVLYGVSILLSASIVCVALMIFLLALLIFYRRVFYSPGLLITGSSAVLLTLYLLFNAALDLALRYQSSIHPEIVSRLTDLIEFLNTQQYDNTSNLSVQVMLNSYNATLISLQTNPFFGTGLGNFSLSYEMAASANFIETRLNANDGYSMFLRLLTEVGVFGLVAFMSIFSARLVQGKLFVSKLKANTSALAIEAEKRLSLSKLYDGFDQQIMMLNASACACLLNALLNYPTYWNIMLPMLFAFCYKVSYRQSPLLLKSIAIKDSPAMPSTMSSGNASPEVHDDGILGDNHASSDGDSQDDGDSKDDIDVLALDFLEGLRLAPLPSEPHRDRDALTDTDDSLPF